MEGIKIVANNKKASFDYFLSNALEVGISLTGTEIKSIRCHGCALVDSYVIIKNDEAFILGMNIPSYDKGNLFNHDPLRVRKLLLHKKEILKYKQKIILDGYTLVCTKVYLKEGRVKLEIALAKGKKNYDKREVMKTKTIKKEIDKAIKNFNR